MTAEGWFALGEITLCGFAIWRHQAAHRGTFPLVPGLLVAHLVLFGLPAALFRSQFLGLDSTLGLLGSIVVPEAISPEALRKTALVIFAGMIALVAGYELPLAPAMLAPLPSVRVTWRRSPTAGALALMGLGLIAANVERGPHPKIIEGILDAVSFVGLWAMGTLWLLSWRGQVHGLARPAAWVMTAMLIGFELIQGALWRPVLDAILLLAVYVRARDRLPRFALALALPMFLALAAAKIGFRSLLPQDESRTASRSEKLDIYLQSLAAVYEDPANLDLGETLLTRMSETWVMATVVERSPRFVPYWGGATYISAAWSLVPRFLVPAKPEEESGQQFPHRYGIIRSDDQQTSTNFAMLIEMYANFGLTGVIAGMTLLGLVCRGLELMLADSGTNDASFSVAAPVSVSLLLIEQPFHGAFGAFVQHAPFLILTLALCGICRFSLIPVDLAVALADRAITRQGAC
jgi:hypothetical protein